MLAAAAGSLLVALIMAVHAGALPPLSFAPFVSVPLGPANCTTNCSQGAIDATAGDFNRDGHVDIVTANSVSDDITVLLGDGQGGLTSSFTVSAAGPSSIASGDLNGDAKLDLVVSEEMAPNKIGVFIGKGDGTFEAEVQYDMGNGPVAVVLADFNGDTKLDVATADLNGPTVSVRLGRGDGTFGDLLQTAVAGAPNGLAVGKLNADNILDLAVTLYDEGRLATLIGNGDGTFMFAGTAAAALVDDSPRGVALADFNRDGKLDAAVATESFDNVDILLGNGDGTFQDFTPYSVGGFPESVAVADYNHDGFLDVASADSFGTIDFDGTVSVLLGNGDGTFQNSQQFAVDPGPYGIVAAGLTSACGTDLVTANLDGQPNTSVSVLKDTSPPPVVSCVGDCNGNGMVTIDELVTGVNIALGNVPVSACPAFDENGDCTVTVNELVKAVNNALNGCTAG